MAQPHDYHHHDHDFPHNRSLHNDHHYIDPDFVANETRDQLPLLSTIGAGPVGAGITARPVFGPDDSFRFVLVDNKTQEAIVTSPNLSAGTISFTQPGHPHAAGEYATIDISVLRDGATKTYSMHIPPGIDGSYLFASDIIYEKLPTGVYQVPLDSLTVRGSNNATPLVPRVNDVVMFVTQIGDKMELSVGYIKQLGNERATVTSRFSIPGTPAPYIGANHNWFVGNVDTGIKAYVSVEIAPTVSLDANKAPTVSDIDPDFFNTRFEFQLPQAVTFGPPFAEQLPEGEAPTVEDVDPSPNQVVLKFGIPQGNRGYTPYIDPDTGNWFINGEDTGLQAQGEQGIQGYTPYIDGETQNWMINGEITSFPSRGEPGPKGDPGALDLRGLYDPTYTYQKGHCVSYNDGTTTDLWYCDDFDVLDVTPGTDPEKWIKVVFQGAQGIQGPPGATPAIDDATGNWWIAGADTGKPSRGLQGIQGDTPEIDTETGNWVIAGSDTGLPSRGVEGPPAVIPIATETTPGIVMVDGDTINVTPEGKISSSPPVSFIFFNLYGQTEDVVYAQTTQELGSDERFYYTDHDGTVMPLYFSGDNPYEITIPDGLTDQSIWIGKDE